MCLSSFSLLFFLSPPPPFFSFVLAYFSSSPCLRSIFPFFLLFLHFQHLVPLFLLLSHLWSLFLPNIYTVLAKKKKKKKKKNRRPGLAIIFPFVLQQSSGRSYIISNLWHSLFLDQRDDVASRFHWQPTSLQVQQRMGLFSSDAVPVMSSLPASRSWQPLVQLLDPLLQCFHWQHVRQLRLRKTPRRSGELHSKAPGILWLLFCHWVGLLSTAPSRLRSRHHQRTDGQPPAESGQLMLTYRVELGQNILLVIPFSSSVRWWKRSMSTRASTATFARVGFPGNCCYVNRALASWSHDRWVETWKTSL